MISFHFPEINTPTLHQLKHYLLLSGAQEGHDSHADFKASHLNYPELELLEFKHLLHQFLAPELSSFQPLTFAMDDSSWTQILQEVVKHRKTHPWILKPSLLNNGQHIKIFQSVEDIKNHFLNSKRLGGPHVLQAYIDEPHLLKGPQFGHKYSLRIFMILTESEAYLYPKGYYNVALKPYDRFNFDYLGAHLTNEHLEHEVLNVVQIPTVQYALFQRFWPQIKEMCRKLALRFLSKYGDKTVSKLAFLGVDFMVDAYERVWLLEVNHGPCFPTVDTHPLYEKLYQGFWQSVVDEIVLPKFSGIKKPLTEFIFIGEVEDSF